jgi:hypothetical protein
VVRRGVLTYGHNFLITGPTVQVGTNESDAFMAANLTTKPNQFSSFSRNTTDDHGRIATALGIAHRISYSFSLTSFDFLLVAGL